MRAKDFLTDDWQTLVPGKRFGLANPRILTVGDDPQGIYDFAVTGKNVLGIRPFTANQWANHQYHARNKGYMLKYTGNNPEKAAVAHAGETPRTGYNMAGEKLEGVAEAANAAQQAAIAISMKKAGKKPKKHRTDEVGIYPQQPGVKTQTALPPAAPRAKTPVDSQQSSFPTDAPVGTHYGSYINPQGVKMNKYVGADLTSVHRPEGEGPPPAPYPTNAPVGTKFGSYKDSATGKMIDKYVDQDLTTRFQPQEKGPWLPKPDDTAAQGTPAHDEATFRTTESAKKSQYNVNNNTVRTAKK